MPEANFSLSAPSMGHPRAFDIGKCNGQPDGHFEMFDADVMLPNMSADATAFQLRNFSTANPSALYEWTPGRFGAPADIPWPPKGLHLAVDFVPPAGAPAALRGIVATVHYEMYDGLATLRKWVSVVNHASRTKPGIRDGGKDQLDGKDEAAGAWARW